MTDRQCFFRLFLAVFIDFYGTIDYNLNIKSRKEVIIMKKVITLVLAFAMLFSLAACASSESKLLGGWQKIDPPVVTDDVAALLEKASADNLGAEYVPTAYIAKQLVSGTNYLVLCEITPVTPDAVGHYSLVYIYEDLQGSVSITDIKDADCETPSEGLMGGWTAVSDPTVTKEAKSALNKAAKDLPDYNYTPLALVSTQVVAGTNYRILCEVSEKGSEPRFEIVEVFSPLEGNAVISHAYAFGE